MLCREMMKGILEVYIEVCNDWEKDFINDMENLLELDLDEDEILSDNQIDKIEQIYDKVCESDL